MTEDAARGVASDIIEISSTLDGIAAMPEGSRTATATQSRDYADMAQIAARPAGRGIGWMAFCLES